MSRSIAVLGIALAIGVVLGLLGVTDKNVCPPGQCVAAETPKAESPKAETKAADAKTPDKTQWRRFVRRQDAKGWKAPAFGNEGKVEVKDGTIVIGAGELMTGVTYTESFPKMNYEVTLEGMRVKGDDFFATTTFPVGDSFVSLVMGGWGGSLVGISSVDFYDASDNPTSRTKDFKDNQWYRIRIRVTKDKIEAWIDKDQTVDLATTGHKLMVRSECEPVPPLRHLHLDRPPGPSATSASANSAPPT